MKYDEITCWEMKDNERQMKEHEGTMKENERNCRRFSSSAKMQEEEDLLLSSLGSGSYERTWIKTKLHEIQ